MTEPEIVFPFGDLTVELRSNGSSQRDGDPIDEGGACVAAIALDVGRSLDNMFAAFDLPNRMALARQVALEVYKTKRRATSG